MFWDIFDDDFWNLDPEDFAIVGAVSGLVEEAEDEEKLPEDPDEDENEPTT